MGDNSAPNTNGVTLEEGVGGDTDINGKRMGGQGEHQQSDTTSQKELKPVKTIAFCRFIVRRHKLAFGLTLGGHILLIVVSAILVQSGYNLFPLSFTGVPLTLTEDETYLRGEAFSMADDSGVIIENSLNSDSGERTKTTETLYLYYEAGNVFTKDNLKAIAAFENELVGNAKYGNFCKLTIAGQCEKPFSIIRLFDGSLPPLTQDVNYSDIVGTLSAAMSNPGIAQLLQFHLGKDAVINATLNIASTSITRTIIYLGHTDQSQRETFLVENFRDKLLSKSDTGIGGMTFIYTSISLFSYDIQRQVIFDLLLAGGSFGFIFLFMLIQTQSLLITGLAVFSVLTSFLGANMVYRIVLDYQYFGIFHVLSIFIILGIGADDVFVYFDTWRATAHENHPTLEERVSACYKRASKAMFATSLTTMIAFFVNALSPLLAVSSFGLFSGILVLVNYISVIVFFPTVVVVHHKHWENWTWPCFRCCKKKTPEISPNHDLKDGERKHPIVRFFRDPFFAFVSHKIIKWVLFVVCLIVLSVFIYFATTLKPEEEAIKIYKDTHNYGKAIDRNLNSFKPSVKDEVIKVYLVWGLKEQDRASCHKTDYECFGRTVWDDGFDLNPKPAQNALFDLCTRIRNMSDAESARLLIRRDSVSGFLDVDCFITDFDTDMAALNSSLPVSETNMLAFMMANPQLYDTSQNMQNFYRYFETGLSYWLYDGYSGTSSTQFINFADHLGFSMDVSDTKNIINKTDRYYGTRLRYAAIVVHTTLRNGKVGFVDGIPVVDAWESFARSAIAKLPPSLSGGFQCTPEGNNAWHWLRVQKTLADSAVKGIIIGICLAFVILTFATQNVVLGFLATATISCVTVTIVGIIPLAGWKLGVLESLNLSLVVGLAVDYVVHLAEGYHLSRHEHRLGRLRDMLETVGISVLSGACTTLGASLFMLFAVILFFMQFGIFMFCTIGFSLFYSLLLFAPLLAICGPQGNFGSLSPVYAWIKDRFRGKKKTDVDCNKCSGQGFHPLEGMEKF
ncbi:protein dispatched homolog 3-like [Haliotis rufescens]|uniref:protein dispatched homolog 3-like n=1 Tax=Haliotis rufescens TaxID=6454 RepID=UPI00201F7ED9|nr:protein dispatched homolog 3-like [Haliotis rufescens]XP_046379987.2 protein dispatched homolog 3-like [Haliotis rufescens]